MERLFSSHRLLPRVTNGVMTCGTVVGWGVFGVALVCVVVGCVSGGILAIGCSQWYQSVSEGIVSRPAIFALRGVAFIAAAFHFAAFVFRFSPVS